MKKVSILISILICVLLLNACGKVEKTASSTESAKTEETKPKDTSQPVTTLANNMVYEKLTDPDAKKERRG